MQCIHGAKERQQWLCAHLSIYPLCLYAKVPRIGQTAYSDAGSLSNDNALLESSLISQTSLQPFTKAVQKPLQCQAPSLSKAVNPAPLILLELTLYFTIQQVTWVTFWHCSTCSLPSAITWPMGWPGDHLAMTLVDSREILSSIDATTMHSTWLPPHTPSSTLSHQTPNPFILYLLFLFFCKL